MELALEISQARRRGSRVGRAHSPPFALHPARSREPTVSEPEHEDVLPFQGKGSGRLENREGRVAHHLSLRVDSPNSTSIMVMIQKRTTTWLSFQPSSS